MRRVALAVCAATLVSTLAPAASAGLLRDTCWVVVPTFRLSGTVCSTVPMDTKTWCFAKVPSAAVAGVVCANVPAGT